MTESREVGLDSFGQLLDTHTLPVSQAFTGRPYDADTGLYDYRARWYDAGVGRFVNEDPSGFDGGDVNLYRYVNNSPTNLVDPYGFEAMAAGEDVDDSHWRNYTWMMGSEGWWHWSDGYWYFVGGGTGSTGGEDELDPLGGDGYEQYPGGAPFDPNLTGFDPFGEDSWTDALIHDTSNPYSGLGSWAFDDDINPSDIALTAEEWDYIYNGGSYIPANEMWLATDAQYVYGQNTATGETLSEQIGNSRGAYWAARDTDLTLGNHHFIVINNSGKVESTNDFTTIGFFPSTDGNKTLDVITNHPTDVQAMREYYGLTKVPLYKADYDAEVHPISTPSAYATALSEKMAVGHLEFTKLILQ